MRTICDQGGRRPHHRGRQRRPPPAGAEAILLPLTHTGKRIGRIIGAMSATSAPHWLGSEPLRSRLMRHEPIWPRWAAALDPGAAGQASADPGEDRRARIKTERRQFRVFEGGLADGRIPKREARGKVKAPPFGEGNTHSADGTMAPNGAQLSFQNQSRHSRLDRSLTGLCSIEWPEHGPVSVWHPLDRKCLPAI
jgi:hypothetical protein